MLAEVFFGSHQEEQGLTPADDDGVWDPASPLHSSHGSAAEARPESRVRAMDIYGTGNEPWFFTTEADAGAFSVEFVTGPGALATRGCRGSSQGPSWSGGWDYRKGVGGGAGEEGDCR